MDSVSSDAMAEGYSLFEQEGIVVINCASRRIEKSRKEI
jgi:hypothetical protein